MGAEKQAFNIIQNQLPLSLPNTKRSTAAPFWIQSQIQKEVFSLLLYFSLCSIQLMLSAIKQEMVGVLSLTMLSL
jgi:hypothetical protein